MKLKPTVIAGNLKGSKLEVNEKTTRPLTSRVKQSVFDTVRDYIDDETKILDLYAGSGSFGIEALSRGARYVTFIERDANAIDLIKQNLHRLGIPEKSFEVIHSGVASELNSINDSFNVIFIDAPFKSTHKVPMDLAIKLLDKEGILVWKIPEEFDYSKYLNEKMNLRYEDKIGKNKILYIARGS